MPAGTGAKKKIRDLKRLIQKADGDAERIAFLTAKIQEVEEDKSSRLEKDKRKKHEDKYHLVKFVERKKLTRLIQRTLRELETSENADQRNNLQTQLDSLKDDLTYVMYYPINMKYVALFARQSKHKNDDDDNQNENRNQMDDREKSLSNRARLLARAARERDLATGKDLVAHAIEVHLNGGSGSKKRKRNESNNGGGLKGGLSEELLLAFKRKADSDEEQDGDVPVLTPTKTISPSSSPPIKHGSRVTGSKDPDISQPTAVSDSSSAHKAKKAKTDRPTSATTKVIIASAPEADAFFVEEVAEAVGAGDQPTLPSRDPRPVRRDYHRVKAVLDHKKHRTHKNLKFKNQNQVRQFSS